MIAYVLKNEEGNYLSMSGGSTNNWFEASKFDEHGIKSREMYLKCGYSLYSFEVQEELVSPKLCGEYCGNSYNVEVTKEGIVLGCSVCNKNKSIDSFVRIK